VYNWRAFYLSALLVLCLDRLTKYLVLKAGDLPKEVLPFLNLTKVWNKGVAFGFMGGSPEFFSQLLLIATPIILILLLILAKRADRKNKIAFGMILGGGLGNWIDRVVFGAVLDFIDLHLGEFHWPAFNVADAGITAGLLLLMVSHVFKDQRK
jgi:signal peptidase II